MSKGTRRTAFDRSGRVIGGRLAVVGLVAAAAASTGVTWAQQQREPAATMSYRGASWLERAERVDEEHPEEVIDAMRLQPGDVVADIGVGSGYFARRIARRVEPTGRVLGVDIQPQMLEILADNARAEGITNIEPILGAVDDPNLGPESVDWMLLVDVYHEIAEPAAMLDNMRRALKPDGRVALLEYRLEDASADHIYPDHRMSVRQVLAEWQPAGFELVELHEFLPSQHMFIFRRADADGARASDEQRRARTLLHVDLSEAVADGLASVEARGRDRASVALRVQRQVDRELVVTLPAGVLFASGGAGDMVAVRDGYALLDHDEVEWVVRAARAHWQRPAPGGDDRLEIRTIVDDEQPARVARAIQAGTYRPVEDARFPSYAPQSVGTAEAALWITLHDAGFDQIESLLRDAQVPPRYALAFGLVYADRSGVEVTATRMWSAHREIFAELQVEDLLAWYRARGR